MISVWSGCEFTGWRHRSSVVLLLLQRVFPISVGRRKGSTLSLLLLTSTWNCWVWSPINMESIIISKHNCTYMPCFPSACVGLNGTELASTLTTPGLYKFQPLDLLLLTLVRVISPARRMQNLGLLLNFLLKEQMVVMAKYFCRNSSYEPIASLFRLGHIVHCNSCLTLHGTEFPEHFEIADSLKCSGLDSSGASQKSHTTPLQHKPPWLLIGFWPIQGAGCQLSYIKLSQVTWSTAYPWWFLSTPPDLAKWVCSK